MKTKNRKKIQTTFRHNQEFKMLGNLLVILVSWKQMTLASKSSNVTRSSFGKDRIPLTFQDTIFMMSYASSLSLNHTRLRSRYLAHRETANILQFYNDKNPTVGRKPHNKARLIILNQTGDTCSSSMRQSEVSSHH